MSFKLANKKIAEPADMTKPEKKLWESTEKIVDDTYNPDKEPDKYYGTLTNIFKARSKKRLGYDPFKKKKKKDKKKKKAFYLNTPAESTNTMTFAGEPDFSRIPGAYQDEVRQIWNEHLRPVLSAENADKYVKEFLPVHGTGLTEAGHVASDRPGSVYLALDSLAQMHENAGRRDELMGEVAATILHEIGHLASGLTGGEAPAEAMEQKYKYVTDRIRQQKKSSKEPRMLLSKIRKNAIDGDVAVPIASKETQAQLNKVLYHFRYAESALEQAAGRMNDIAGKLGLTIEQLGVGGINQIQQRLDQYRLAFGGAAGDALNDPQAAFVELMRLRPELLGFLKELSIGFYAKQKGDSSLESEMAPVESILSRIAAAFVQGVATYIQSLPPEEQARLQQDPEFTNLGAELNRLLSNVGTSMGHLLPHIEKFYSMLQGYADPGKGLKKKEIEHNERVKAVKAELDRLSANIEALTWNIDAAERSESKVYTDPKTKQEFSAEQLNERKVNIETELEKYKAEYKSLTGEDYVYDPGSFEGEIKPEFVGDPGTSDKLPRMSVEHAVSQVENYLQLNSAASRWEDELATASEELQSGAITPAKYKRIVENVRRSQDQLKDLQREVKYNFGGPKLLEQDKKELQFKLEKLQEEAERLQSLSGEEYSEASEYVAGLNKNIEETNKDLAALDQFTPKYIPLRQMQTESKTLWQNLNTAKHNLDLLEGSRLGGTVELTETKSAVDPDGRATTTPIKQDVEVTEEAINKYKAKVSELRERKAKYDKIYDILDALNIGGGETKPDYDPLMNEIGLPPRTQRRGEEQVEYHMRRPWERPEVIKDNPYLLSLQRAFKQVSDTRGLEREIERIKKRVDRLQNAKKELSVLKEDEFGRVMFDNSGNPMYEPAEVSRKKWELVDPARVESELGRISDVTQKKMHLENSDVNNALDLVKEYAEGLLLGKDTGDVDFIGGRLSFNGKQGADANGEIAKIIEEQLKNIHNFSQETKLADTYKDYRQNKRDYNATLKGMPEEAMQAYDLYGEQHAYLASQLKDRLTKYELAMSAGNQAQAEQIAEEVQQLETQMAGYDVMRNEHAGHFEKLDQGRAGIDGLSAKLSPLMNVLGIKFLELLTKVAEGLQPISTMMRQPHEEDIPLMEALNEAKALGDEGAVSKIKEELTKRRKGRSSGADAKNYEAAKRTLEQANWHDLIRQVDLAEQMEATVGVGQKGGTPQLSEMTPEIRTRYQNARRKRDQYERLVDLAREYNIDLKTVIPEAIERGPHKYEETEDPKGVYRRTPLEKREKPEGEEDAPMREYETPEEYRAEKREKAEKFKEKHQKEYAQTKKLRRLTQSGQSSSAARKEYKNIRQMYTSQAQALNAIKSYKDFLDIKADDVNKLVDLFNVRYRYDKEFIDNRADEGVAKRELAAAEEAGDQEQAAVLSKKLEELQATQGTLLKNLAAVNDEINDIGWYTTDLAAQLRALIKMRGELLGDLKSAEEMADDEAVKKLKRELAKLEQKLTAERNHVGRAHSALTRKQIGEKPALIGLKPHSEPGVTEEPRPEGRMTSEQIKKKLEPT